MNLEKQKIKKKSEFGKTENNKKKSEFPKKKNRKAKKVNFQITEQAKKVNFQIKNSQKVHFQIKNSQKVHCQKVKSPHVSSAFTPNQSSEHHTGIAPSPKTNLIFQGTTRDLKWKNIFTKPMLVLLQLLACIFLN